MTIHLIPVMGQKVNEHWGMNNFGRYEKVFIRCDKHGKYKRMNDKTIVYRGFDVLYEITEHQKDYFIHWDKLATNL